MAVAGLALFLAAPNAAAAVNDSNAAPAPAAPAASGSQQYNLPSGVTEVMKMYKGAIPADIMISYINNSPLVFYLSADNIISLQQQGLPLPVINAMINRYGQLQRQSSMMAGPAQTQQPQYAAPQVQVPAQAPAPQYYSYAPSEPAVSYPVEAPVYDPYYYDSYYYDPFYYPGYWGWPVGFSFGYYGGFGHGYYRGGYGYGGVGHGGFGGGGIGHGGFGGGHAGGGGIGGGGRGGGIGGGGRGGGGIGGGGHGGGGGHR
jgi:hypothetical protein